MTNNQILDFYGMTTTGLSWNGLHEVKESQDEMGKQIHSMARCLGFFVAGNRFLHI